ncbi:hypothetical protein [uncultured Pseudomonas sp.]|uniref:hypothetical protein n=1 Tax=uncultured Pseudomonas sp. TaxID=114707 RepID=UPI00206D9995|nr:hypothetical protein [uncultured Pseudomonas sp.]DAO42974.1 MAG TPA: hypothetical protein [Caudoviricetes sp.]
MKKLAMAFTFAAITSGCTQLGITEQKTVIHKDLSDNGELSIASIPTQLRGAYVTKKTNNSTLYTYCAEPFADVAASNSLKATADANNKLNTLIDAQASRTNSDGSNQTASAKTDQQIQQVVNGTLETINTIVKLEGRTQYVLLAREMMYRTCEAATNGWLGNTPEDIAKNVSKEHTQVVDALTTMLAAEKEKAVAESNTAVAAVVKAVESKKVDKSVLQKMTAADAYGVMRKALLDELVKCTEKAKTEKDKSGCQSKFNDQYKKLR